MDKAQASDGAFPAQAPTHGPLWQAGCLVLRRLRALGLAVLGEGPRLRWPSNLAVRRVGRQKQLRILGRAAENAFDRRLLDIDQGPRRCARIVQGGFGQCVLGRSQDESVDGSVADDAATSFAWMWTKAGILARTARRGVSVSSS